MSQFPTFDKFTLYENVDTSAPDRIIATSNTYNNNSELLNAPTRIPTGNRNGRPPGPPQKKYTVKLPVHVLAAARSKHPDLHRQIVEFVKGLAETL